MLVDAIHVVADGVIVNTLEPYPPP